MQAKRGSGGQADPGWEYTVQQESYRRRRALSRKKRGARVCPRERCGEQVREEREGQVLALPWESKVDALPASDGM